MFILLATLATACYALNSVLLAPLARRIDPVLLNAVRGASLGLTMSPVLLFVPNDAASAITDNVALILFGACAAAVIGNVCSCYAQRYLPVGISLACCLAFAAIVATVIGIIFRNDVLTSAQVVIGMLILTESVILGAVSQKRTFAALNVKLGMLWCLGFGVALGIGYSFIGIASEKMHPVLAGYIWEFGTGVLCFCFLAVRALLRSVNFGIQSSLDYIKIGLASAPTVLGTSLYALATTKGSLGVLGAVLSTMGAMAAFLSYCILKERLTKWQSVMIGCMVITLMILKLNTE